VNCCRTTGSPRIPPPGNQSLHWHTRRPGSRPQCYGGLTACSAPCPCRVTLTLRPSFRRRRRGGAVSPAVTYWPSRPSSHAWRSSAAEAAAAATQVYVIGHVGGCSYSSDRRHIQALERQCDPHRPSTPEADGRRTADSAELLTPDGGYPAGFFETADGCAMLATSRPAQFGQHGGRLRAHPTPGMWQPATRPASKRTRSSRRMTACGIIDIGHADTRMGLAPSASPILAQSPTESVDAPPPPPRTGRPT
jgi:hypothetical protein